MCIRIGASEEACRLIKAYNAARRSSCTSDAAFTVRMFIEQHFVYALESDSERFWGELSDACAAWSPPELRAGTAEAEFVSALQAWKKRMDRCGHNSGSQDNAPSRGSPMDVPTGNGEGTADGAAIDMDGCVCWSESDDTMGQPGWTLGMG